MKPLSAKFLEARVNGLARLAELDVVVIAESENGVFEILETRSGSILKIVPNDCALSGISPSP
jgi:hypothetical protein